ncbi:MAG: hypothetical protein ACK504_11285 [Bacteroidota bacterium]
MKQKVLLLLATLVFLSCKKEQDTVSVHDIKGMVFNNCTDSGLAKVTVFLKDGQGLNLSTVSDAKGNFKFNAVSIHSSSKYSYVIYIQSKSGDIGSAPTIDNCGFRGATLYFNYDEADLFFKPRVIPWFYRCAIYCIKNPITNTNDSIIFYAKNYTIHKNAPDYGWAIEGGAYGFSNDGSANLGDYPMGKYILEIDMWKSGVHTTRKDSIYLPWAAHTSYTINW